MSPGELILRLERIGYPDIDDFDNPPAEYLRPEALVYLYRHHWVATKRAHAARRSREVKSHRGATEAVADTLDHFVARSASKWLSKLTGQARERAEDEVLDRMSTLLNDLDLPGEVLEVCFGKVLRGRCINAFDKHSKAADPSRLSDYSKKGEPAVSGSPQPSPDSTAHVNLLLERLPAAQREAFVRRKLDDTPYRELEEELGVSDRTIRDRAKEAVKALRKLHNEDERDNDKHTG